MIKLLIIADDFTGALDTGVQFAARGAATCVIPEPDYDFAQTDENVQVLVLDAETRHLSAERAYDVVFRIVCGALTAGFAYIYKKTDSALRGNIGSELTAVLDAAQADRLAFLPAFPTMNRVTRGGIHYIDGIPVSESVFGQDPFEPVSASAVADIIAKQSKTPVALCGKDGSGEAGIQIYDGETEEDLLRTGRRLMADGVRLFAGCAGFAAALVELLNPEGERPRIPKLPESLFVACGSVNPVTLRQIHTAQEAGFPHVCLSPVQKLEPAWLESGACSTAVEEWLRLTQRHGCCILDVNDPDGCEDTAIYAKARGLTTEDLRVRISTELGQLMRRLLDDGLNAVMLCTGGDTLLAMMRAVDVLKLTPVCEIKPGAVLTSFIYREKRRYLISKSGGFGNPELFCELAALIRAEKKKEDSIC